MTQFHDEIFVIGAGAMAEAVIRGLTEHGAVDPALIHVTNRSNQERLNRMASEYKVDITSDWSVMGRCRVIVLATKPADAAAVLRQATPHLQGQLIVSLAAGITMDVLHKACEGRGAIVRTMPNIPVAVLAGVTAVAFEAAIDERDKDDIRFLLRQIGDVVEIPETRMDAVTAVSGSGPGFVSYMLEAMETAAVELGFEPAVARRLLLQTVIGTAKTLSEWELSPGELRRRVTSPNGTTFAGLQAMEEGQVPSAIREALHRAAARSAEMARLYASKD